MAEEKVGHLHLDIFKQANGLMKISAEADGIHNDIIVIVSEIVAGAINTPKDQRLKIWHKIRETIKK